MAGEYKYAKLGGETKMHCWGCATRMVFARVPRFTTSTYIYIYVYIYIYINSRLGKANNLRFSHEGLGRTKEAEKFLMKFRC